MTGLRETACSFTAALVCLLAFAAPASAQFETRSVRPVNPNPDSIAVGDFNRDGKLDIAEVGVLGSQRVAVYWGNGDGTFQSAAGDTVGQRPSSIAVADFNHNGKLDLVVANSDSNTVGILKSGTISIRDSASLKPQVIMLSGTGTECRRSLTKVRSFSKSRRSG